MRIFFLADSGEPSPRPGERVVLDREESHHALTVLRRAERDPVGLVDGNGGRYTARLVDRDGKRAVLEILTAEQDETEVAAPRLCLACGVVKGRHWEWVLEKAVELGVHRIVPLLTEFGVVEPRDGRRDRWLAVMRSALKQSHRAWLPELDEPCTLAAFLKERPAGPLWFGAVPDERTAPAAEPAAAAGLPWLAVAVGPEGGWSPSERADLLGAGATMLDLGPHVLRTETAAAAGLVVLQGLRRRAILDTAAPGGI